MKMLLENGFLGTCLTENKIKISLKFIFVRFNIFQKVFKSMRQT